jgi:hypothetical protein
VKDLAHTGLIGMVQDGRGKKEGDPTGTKVPPKPEVIVMEDGQGPECPHDEGPLPDYKHDLTEEVPAFSTGPRPDRQTSLKMSSAGMGQLMQLLTAVLVKQAERRKRANMMRGYGPSAPTAPAAGMGSPNARAATAASTAQASTAAPSNMPGPMAPASSNTVLASERPELARLLAKTSMPVMPGSPMVSTPPPITGGPARTPGVRPVGAGIGANQLVANPKPQGNPSAPGSPRNM